MTRFRALLAAALFASASAAHAAAAPSEIEAHRRLAERVFLEKMGQGRFDRVDEIYAPDFRARTPDGDVSLDEDNASGREWRKAIPNLKGSVIRSVVEADLAAVHWRATGTNRVAAAGLPGLGKHIDIEGMTFFRFSGGRIAEEWSVIDVARMLAQVGG